jgi:hypothetical protein
VRADKAADERAVAGLADFKPARDRLSGHLEDEVPTANQGIQCCRRHNGFS